MKLSAKGFTLIELLIVIAVLGILAVAVLAAINPIEQINRSRDTGSRSDAEQLIGAIDRFYASKGYYPWVNSPTSAYTLGWTPVDASWVDDKPSEPTPVLSKLSQAGTEEIKASFVSRISASGYNTLYIYNKGVPGSSTYVCFKPKSGSFSDDAYNRCSASGGYGTLPSDYPADKACPTDGTCSASNKTGCYSCLP